MLESFYQNIYRYLSKKAFETDDDLFVYGAISVVSAFACAFHLILTIFFFISGISNLFFINILSVSVYCVILVILNYKDVHNSKYLVAGILFSYEILIYTVIAVYFTGGNNYAILFLLLDLVVQVIVPYTNGKIRAFVSLNIIVALLFSCYMQFFNLPIYDLGKSNFILAVITIIGSAIAFIVEAFLQQFLQTVINKFNETRIQELKEQAYVDPLTKLHNRRYAESVFDYLKTLHLDDRRDVCVAIADLDDFKSINDTFGHEAGDAILVRMSQIMTASFRKSDYIFRWGGEEFLFVLIGANLSNSFDTLERLRKRIELETVAYNDKILNITITMGLVELNDDIPKSISFADKKLYEGKRNGKNKTQI